MKTVFCTGGSAVVDDDTADATLDYSMALARLNLMGTATISDHASEESTSQMVITVGFGVPVTLRSSPTTSSETSFDIRRAALASPAQTAWEVDPRYDFDADYYRLSTHADPLGKF